MARHKSQEPLSRCRGSQRAEAELSLKGTTGKSIFPASARVTLQITDGSNTMRPHPLFPPFRPGILMLSANCMLEVMRFINAERHAAKHNAFG